MAAVLSRRCFIWARGEVKSQNLSVFFKSNELFHVWRAGKLLQKIRL